MPPVAEATYRTSPIDSTAPPAPAPMSPPSAAGKNGNGNGHTTTRHFESVELLMVLLDIVKEYRGIKQDEHRHDERMASLRAELRTLRSENVHLKGLLAEAADEESETCATSKPVGEHAEATEFIEANFLGQVVDDMTVHIHASFDRVDDVKFSLDTSEDGQDSLLVTIEIPSDEGPVADKMIKFLEYQPDSCREKRQYFNYRVIRAGE